MHIRLKDISTRAPEDLDKQTIKEETDGILGELSELQNLLYAESKHAILVIIQGMDASGKDGLSRNVFSRMNPQGVDVASFKTPTDEELAHDFLWRIHLHTPAKGMIQIFNRSQYEDVLITRVHQWISDKDARRKMRAINHFESLLMEHGHTHILKFYLHVSADEQEKRLEERVRNPAKMWKYNEADFREAKNRKAYIKYYEDVFTQCNEPAWHIVPADQNWYKEYIVAKKLRDTLVSLKMQFPGLKK